MKLQYLAHFMFIMFVGGCLAHRREAYTSTASITAEEQRLDRLWNSAHETLRDYRFRLDRVDRQEGVMTTLPVASKHFFEFWRKDVATREDFWEATINPLRRWIEVRFTQGEGGQWTELAVLVHKERLSTPDRQFNSTAAAYQYFGSALPATTGETRLTTANDVWVDLGRDAALEELLLQQILQRAESPSGSEG